MPSVQAVISGARLFVSLMHLLSFDSAITQKFSAFTAMQIFCFLQTMVCLSGFLKSTDNIRYENKYCQSNRNMPKDTSWWDVDQMGVLEVIKRS